MGYQGRAVEDLIRELLAARVSIVVDVRLNAISRKRGLSKRALRDALERVGIRYLHLSALGNPRDNREAFRAGDVAAQERFVRSLSSPEGDAALELLLEQTADGTVAVLCFEADHETCHRAFVVDEAVTRMPELQAIQV